MPFHSGEGETLLATGAGAARVRLVKRRTTQEVRSFMFLSFLDLLWILSLLFMLENSPVTVRVSDHCFFT